MIASDPDDIGITPEVARQATRCMMRDNTCPACGAYSPPDDPRGGIDVATRRIDWCGCVLSRPPWPLLTLRLLDQLRPGVWSFKVAGLCQTGCDHCLFGVHWRPGLPVWQAVRCKTCAPDTPLVVRSGLQAHELLLDHMRLYPTHTVGLEMHTVVASAWPPEILR